MKRMMTIIFASVLACIVLTGCVSDEDWSLNYGEQSTDGKWEGALDRKHDRAIATVYHWDGSEEGKRIEASMIDGCTVIKYGGFFGRGLPCPFYVDYKDGLLYKTEEVEPVFDSVLARYSQE